MTFRLLILALIFTVSNAYAGGGWTHEKGNGYFKLSLLNIKANSHFTSNGGIDPNITIGYLSTNAYAEYGITDKWTAIVNFSLFARNFHNQQVSQTTGDVLTAGEAINGVGDIDLAIKYGIFKSDHVAIAGTFLLGIPSGKTGQGEMGILALGDGEFNQMIRFDVSTPWKAKNSPMYANVYVGFNHRTKGFSEEFRWGAEIGVGLIKEHLWLAAKLDGLTSFKNGKTSAELSSTGASLFANNAEYISYSLEVAAKLYKGFGVSFNYGSAFKAKVIFAAPIYTAGIFYDLK